eukprot:15533933-Heterocapsa_arctica.AAC.1
MEGGREGWSERCASEEGGLAGGGGPYAQDGAALSVHVGCWDVVAQLVAFVAECIERRMSSS